MSMRRHTTGAAGTGFGVDYAETYAEISATYEQVGDMNRCRQGRQTQYRNQEQGVVQETRCTPGVVERQNRELRRRERGSTAGWIR